MSVIYLASTSAVKQKTFSELLGPHGFTIEPLDLRMPEIQDIDVRVVSKQKAREAARLADVRPVLVDDTGLEFPDLLGAPGALLKPMLDHGGLELIHRMTRAFHVDGQCRARYVCALTLVAEDRTIEADGAWDGVLDLSGRAGEVGPTVRDCSAVFRSAPGEPTLTEQAREQGAGAYLHRARAVQDLVLELTKAAR